MPRPPPSRPPCIEPEAAGRDLIVSAQTGSGKTVAFGLAMAAELLGEDGDAAAADAPLALVIAPTRELALQVSRELMWLYAKAGARIATCVGGMDASQGAPRAQPRRAHRRRHARAACATISNAARSTCRRCGSPCSTRPTRCSTWAFARISRRSSTRTPDDAPHPAVLGDDAQADRRARQALPARRAAHLDRRRGSRPWRHRLSGGHRRRPSDIEHAVVNLLRFHEAETAMLFCATRDNVRHLHATLRRARLRRRRAVGRA